MYIVHAMQPLLLTPRNQRNLIYTIPSKCHLSNYLFEYNRITGKKKRYSHIVVPFSFTKLLAKATSLQPFFVIVRIEYKALYD